MTDETAVTDEMDVTNEMVVTIKTVVIIVTDDVLHTYVNTTWLAAATFVYICSEEKFTALLLCNNINSLWKEIR